MGITTLSLGEMKMIMALENSLITTKLTTDVAILLYSLTHKCIAHNKKCNNSE